MAGGPKRRLILVITLLIGCVIVLVARLVSIQVVDHRTYKREAEKDHVRPVRMEKSPRGVIRDRDGNLLAGNSVMYAINANLGYVRDKGETAASLGSVLHTPAAHIRRKLDTDKSWVRIASPVSIETQKAVRELDLAGIELEPLWVREYPEGTLASHALGFATVITGYYGVEGYYDAWLRPVQSSQVKSMDIYNKPVPWAAASVEEPRSGGDLGLTLDRTVQALVEEELARSVREYKAEGGTIIVMDPHTFGILAIASWPNYDPERYSEFASQTPPPFEDPAVSQQYEPGSVFKILTVAAALDSGTVTPETTYNDPGEIEVGEQVIKNAYEHEHRDYTVSDILIESLNVGAAWLSTKMGPETFYQYLQSFGIRQRTKVDLAGEIAGQLWLPSDYEHWHQSYLGVNAFGQGVAVTPLQMVTAVAAVANDGVRMQPHIVKRRTAPDGDVASFQPTNEAQVISTQTAQTLMEMMVQVVEEGVPEAQVPGYRVAGKTGTAQIPIPGGYARDETITSFAGFGPVPDPQIVVLVKLDRPKTSSWASKTAAPTFSRLTSRLFTILGIPPSDVATLQ